MNVTQITPDLNEQQVDAIIAEALNHRFFERGPDGNLPADFEQRKEAAQELLRQSRMAHAAGNRSKGVIALLYIAEVDQNPQIPEIQQGADMPETVDQELVANQSDSLLLKYEQSLLEYPDSDEREANLVVIHAEMEKRGLREKEQSNGGDPEAERQALLKAINFPIILAHQIDPKELDSYDAEKLRWILENPEGPPKQEAEEKVQGEEETIQTTKMVLDQPPEEPKVTKEPAQGASGLSPEREDLESRVTGPMLRVYGRGRKDIPRIGINELRFMLEHPDARVTKEQFEAAVALDRAPQPEEPEDDGFAPEVETPAPAEEDGGATPLPPEGGSLALPVIPSGAPRQEEPLSDSAGPEREAASEELQIAGIIERERFPIPPEISEDPPVLPFDLSKLSDAELASYHARFHACQSRANWVVGIVEAELKDVQRLRKGREVEVANDLPVKDGRVKVTESQREAMIAADGQVVRYREQEHEIEKKLRKLMLLRDNYGRDVSVCSRQWSFRHEEKSAAGGLR